MVHCCAVLCDKSPYVICGLVLRCVYVCLFVCMYHQGHNNLIVGLLFIFHYYTVINCGGRLNECL